MKEFTYSFDTLPDVISQTEFTVTDPEDSTLKTWHDYLYDFHGRRMIDGEPFDITDPQSGGTIAVKFADEDEIEFRWKAPQVYSAQIRLVQWRDPED